MDGGVTLGLGTLTRGALGMTAHDKYRTRGFTGSPKRMSLPPRAVGLTFQTLLWYYVEILYLSDQMRLNRNAILRSVKDSDVW